MPRTYGHSEHHSHALVPIEVKSVLPVERESGTDVGAPAQASASDSVPDQEGQKTPLKKLIEGFKGNE